MYAEKRVRIGQVAKKVLKVFHLPGRISGHISQIWMGTVMIELTFVQLNDTVAAPPGGELLLDALLDGNCRIWKRVEIKQILKI